jgi:hypothetical protein
MAIDHMAVALKLVAVEFFTLGALTLFAPATANELLGKRNEFADAQAFGASMFALALAAYYSVRPDPINREHIKVSCAAQSATTRAKKQFLSVIFFFSLFNGFPRKTAAASSWSGRCCDSSRC